MVWALLSFGWTKGLRSAGNFIRAENGLKALVSTGKAGVRQTCLFSRRLLKLNAASSSGYVSYV